MSTNEKIVLEEKLNEIIRGLDRREKDSKEMLAKVEEYQSEHKRVMKIEQYLHLLFAAQNSGHSVNREIDDALKLYRQELGI